VKQYEEGKPTKSVEIQELLVAHPTNNPQEQRIERKR
jgi:hypothetical protein